MKRRERKKGRIRKGPGKCWERDGGRKRTGRTGPFPAIENKTDVSMGRGSQRCSFSFAGPVSTATDWTKSLTPG